MDEIPSDSTHDSNNISNLDEGKPLIQLFKCLINDRDKQNTVLTNQQVMDILQKEFKVKVIQMHTLELDIYMNVMKKFLKLWPEWDEFDRIIGNLKSDEDFKELDNILIEKYNSLKTYLKHVLEASRPAAQDMVKSVITESTNQTTDNTKKLEAEDVVMEVQCTRAQMNQLFFRRPNAKFNSSIINIADCVAPSRISLNTLSLKSIFNWSLVSIHINLFPFTYKRDTLHRLRHTLINKIVHPYVDKPPILDTSLYEKELQKLTAYSRESVEKALDKMVNVMIKNNTLYKNIINIIFDLIKDDLKHFPKTFKVPGKFKRYANRYPYVRYLSTDPESEVDQDKFDLQLEEQILPAYHYYVGRVNINFSSSNPIVLANDWLRIECIYCQLKFYGLNVLENVQQHFNEVHQQELDWQCMNCQKNFSMAYISEKKWYHRC